MCDTLREKCCLNSSCSKKINARKHKHPECRVRTTNPENMDISAPTHWPDWQSLPNLKFSEYVDTVSFGGFLHVYNLFLQASLYPLELSLRHVCLWSGRGECVSADPDWPTIQANTRITTAACKSPLGSGSGADCTSLNRTEWS